MSLVMINYNSPGINFVEVFPPELSNVLFSYIPDRDLFSASQCCISWRNTINNNQQWAKRCLKNGWTSKLTLDEPHLWKNLSHDHTSDRGRSRPTLAFNLDGYLISAFDSLNPLCDWAIYFRQRLHTLKNWWKGNYVIHELVSPESKLDTLIVSDSAYNGKYLVIGTTTGYVFIWNVAEIPQMINKIKPILPKKEVRKIIITSKGRLVVVYEGTIIHVYEEEDCGSGCITFPLKVLGRIFLEMSDNSITTLQAEIWTKSDLILLASDIDGREVGPEKYLKLISTGTKKEVPLVEDLLYSLSGETILISCEGESSYILWDLKDDKQDRQIQRLPVSHKISQILLDDALLIFAFEKDELSGSNYGILAYDAVKFNDSVKITLNAEYAAPTFVDEMTFDRNRKGIAFCSNGGMVGAFCVKSNSSIFQIEAETTVDNLTSCKELILYHDSTEYNIMAVSWLGTFLYKITQHIGPIRGIRCIGQFIVSGGAAKELMVWEKTSGKLVHRVYHQPSHIINLYVGPTCILTVGKDDPPVLIGYL